MPSLLDLLEHDDGIPEPEPPAQVLHAVKAEGGRRRTVRHCRTAGLALAGLLLVGAPVVALQAGEDGPRREVNVATDGGSDPGVVSDPVALPPLEPVPTTALAAAPGTSGSPGTTVAPASTTTTAAAGRPAVAPTTTVKTDGPVVPQTTPTTQRVCRNSDNPACGEFRWDPAPPANQALEISFTSVPANPKAGQAVTFAVTWSDDAGVSYDYFSTDGRMEYVACSPAPRYGPWTPPAQVAQGETKQYSATFPSPGEYTVSVHLQTGDCGSPYADQKTVSVPVTVEPA